MGEEVGDLDISSQKPIRITANNKGVRFDVFAKGGTTIYDVEMQNANRDSLPHRARYSHALIDLEQLEAGAHYCEMHRSLVIFICSFKLFKNSELHKYSFRKTCLEDTSLLLNDGTETIFICTEGASNDISKDMRMLLDYVAGKQANNDFTRKLQKAVDHAKENPVWRKEFMDFQDYMDMAREEGLEEGLKKGREEGLAEAEAKIKELEARIAELMNKTEHS